MDYVKNVLIFLVIVVLVYWFVFPFADDLMLFQANMHRQLQQTEMAIDAYIRVIENFKSSVVEAEANLYALNPNHPLVAHLNKNKKK